ncbi:MAG: exodeoxyribonuclease V subunit gamma, partial [Alphaproteobacteria bacterium]|nr:exodeoxyribonuclease V subunit gamma [Alphaproteobacteria bacterium]
DIQNVLDCRESEIGDDIQTAKNRNAFLCQLLSAQDGCFISYQNANLQKDEQLYVSSVANEIIDFVGKENDTQNAKYILCEDVISVDETRDWGQIFSPRAARNKTNYTNLTNEIVTQTNNDAVDNNTEKLDLPDKVRISALSKFLEDAFAFSIDSKLGYDDDLVDIENQDTESYDLDNIAKSNLKKLYVKLKMQNTPDEEIEKNIMAQITCDKPFDKYIYIKQIKEAEDLYKKIKNIDISEFDGATNLQLHNDVANKNWVLSGPLAWHNKDFTTSVELNVVNMKKGNLLSAYVTSLVLVAGQQDNKKISVSLVNPTTETKQYTLSPSEAREYLNKIYESAYKDKYSKCLPIKFTDDKEFNKIDSLSAFINSLKKEHDGPWLYFKNGKLIDANKDLGYINENFDKEFQQNIKEKIRLIKYLDKTKDAENE